MGGLKLNTNLISWGTKPPATRLASIRRPLYIRLVAFETAYMCPCPGTRLFRTHLVASLDVASLLPISSNPSSILHLPMWLGTRFRPERRGPQTPVTVCTITNNASVLRAPLLLIFPRTTSSHFPAPKFTLIDTPLRRIYPT